MHKKIIKFTLLTLFFAAIVAIGSLYFLYKSQHPSTDDAYIKANIVNIAPQITGTVKSVHIQNHQHVDKGEILFTIDKASYDIAQKKAEANLANTIQSVKAADADVKTAEANVEQAQAAQINTEKNTQRILALVKQQLASPSEGDKATSELEIANASLSSAKSQLTASQQKRGAIGDKNAAIKSAQADLASANLNLSYTTVTSPTSGYVANFSLQSGDQLTAYQPQFTIVDDNHWWVDANFKETDLKRITKGQKATVVLDMYPSISYEGTVSSISVGSGSSFSLLPTENATGNWVKVTQRFPVKISIEHSKHDAPLRLGASATVTINTKTPPSS